MMRRDDHFVKGFSAYKYTDGRDGIVYTGLAFKYYDRALLLTKSTIYLGDGEDVCV